MSRTRTALAGAVLLTGLLAVPSALADECEGGVTAPVKEELHALEGPLEPTGLGEVVHTVECTLP